MSSFLCSNSKQPNAGIRTKSKDKTKDKKKDTATPKEKEEQQPENTMDVVSDIELQSTSHMVIRLCFYDKEDDDDAALELKKQADRVDDIVESGIRAVNQYLDSDGLEEEEPLCKATMYIYWSSQSRLYHVSGIASSSSDVPYHFRFGAASEVASFVQEMGVCSNEPLIMYLNMYNYNTLDKDIDDAIEDVKRRNTNPSANVQWQSSGVVQIGSSLPYHYFESLDTNDYCIGNYIFMSGRGTSPGEYDLSNDLEFYLVPYLNLLCAAR